MADTPIVGKPTPPPVATPPTATPAPEKHPTITSANLPPELAKPTGKERPFEELTVQDDSDIVAKPLISPDFTKLRPSNPNMSLRLVNRLALGGQRFEEAKIQGFIVCKPADIKDVPSIFNTKDGVVTYGDVIAMMMPRADYIGAIKNNEANARRRVSRAAAFGSGQENLIEALNEVPGSRENKGKIKLFTPER